MKKCFYVASLLLLVFLVGCTNNNDYEVTFETNGGTPIETITSLEDLQSSELTTTKDGYQFEGWFFDADFTTPFDILEIDEPVFTLYAKWSSILVDYHIDIYQEDLEGAFVLVDHQTHEDEIGQVVTATPEVFDGYTFDQEHALNHLSDTLTEDGAQTLSLYYTRNGYTITYETNSSLILEPETYKYQQDISEPSALSRYAYTFDGWYIDQDLTTPYDFETMPANHITLYAKWNLIIVDYHVKHYQEALDGTYVLVDDLTLEDGLGFDISATPNTYVGFTFDEDHPNNHLSDVTSEDGLTTLSLYYQRNTNTITFDSNANLSITSITAKYEETISEPNTPVRLGYTFIGWYMDQDLTTPYLFTTMPAEDITLYAKWEGEITTLYFNSMGGSQIDQITAPLGSDITAPSHPLRDGYDFVGWYKDLNYQILFDTWVMPYGGITLYARWVEKTFTITFNTDGGTSIDPLDVKYTYSIAMPDFPTKTDYIFGGWFLDQEYLNPFTDQIMPMQHLTLYAKWLDVADTNTILYQSSLDRYTEITISGTVYAILDAPYQGYILNDNTASIIVYDDQIVSIGDHVTLTGSLYHHNDIPSLMNITDFRLNLEDQTGLAPIIKTIDELNNYPDDLSHFGKTFEANGILIYENDHYYLVDQNTYSKIEITNHFNQDELNALINQKVAATLIFMNYQDTWQAGLLSYISSPYTDVEMIADTENYLISLFNQTYFSYETIDFPSTNPMGLTTISVSLVSGHESSYNFDTKMLSEVLLPSTVSFWVEIEVNSTTTIIKMDFDVEPISLLTVTDFKALTTGDQGAILGIIIFKSDSTSLYGIYDGTETIYVYTDTYLEVGDEVLILAKKSVDDLMPVIMDDDIRLLIIQSKENPITYPVTQMDDASFLALDLNDPSIYGQKVELRGFIQDIMYGHGFTLELDQKTIPIEPISYDAFEGLMAYIGLEIDIKGYVTLLDDQTLGLYIEGIRLDYQIPDYSASERVDMILTLFSRTYANKEFYAFDEFILYPYHPVLGASITYNFIEGGQYYDEANSQFIYTESPVSIKLELTISKDDVTQTYLYQTTLNPVEVTPIEDLMYLNNYDLVYVQGIVIYRSPYLAYIKDDTGIVKLRMRDLNCYIGDEVVIYGEKELSNYDYGQISISSYEYIEPVIAILSRGNAFSVPILEGFDILNDFDPETTLPYNQMISLSGTLSGSYPNFYITDGTNQVDIDTETGYTLYKLEKLLGLSITIEGIIIRYNDNYELFYMDIEGDLTVNPYSDQDMLDHMSASLTSLTSEPVMEGHTLLLPTTYDLFNAIITYQMDVSYETYYDLEYGYASYVDDITTIPITATIYLSETVYQSVSLTITIMPSITYEQVLISELMTLPLATYKLQAKIIGITRYNDNYAFIIQDESGKIFVPLSNAYFYNSTYVGRPVTVYGSLSYNDGRPEVANATYVVSSYSTSVETIFEETEISEVTQYDLYDASLYGKPLLISGKVIQLDYYNYAITDGKNTLKINSVYQSIYNLERYVGLNAILKVFFVGDLDDDGIYDVVINNAFYGGTSTMAYGDYTDQDFIDIIYQDIIDTIDFRIYKAYEEVYISNYHSYFPSATITYEISSDPLSANLIGNALQFNPVTQDQEVIITMNITYGLVTDTFELRFDLKHADIKGFSDLFELLPELDEMGLRGQMIYHDWQFVYVLIEGDIYYLEGYFNGSYAYGEQILIHGKKSTIEGSTAYTYDIDILSTDIYDPLVLPPSYTTLEALDLDNLDPNVLKQVLTLYGLLRYDEFLGWYYLEPTSPDTGIRIYLRAEIEDYESWSYSILRQDSISKYMMDQHLNLPIYVDVLNPGIRILDEYVLVDLIPEIANMRLEEMTPLQKIGYGKDYLDEMNENLIFYPGDYLYHKFPHYHEALDLSFDFDFNDPLDVTYGEITSGDSFKSITQITTITMSVTISYYDPIEDIEYQDTHLLDITIHPIEMSSIYDVLWGKTDQVYKVTGTIIYIFEDQYMLISDGTDIIYVETYYLSNYFIIDLELNDTVMITAYRYFYDYGDYIPILSDIIDIEEITPVVISSQTPVSLTLDDILKINILLPSELNSYITYTGTLIKVGTTYYEYSIRFEGEDDQYYDLALRGNMDEATFDALLSPYIGQEITVTGYLSLFEFLHDPFDWYLLYESFEPVVS